MPKDEKPKFVVTMRDRATGRRVIVSRQYDTPMQAHDVSYGVSKPGLIATHSHPYVAVVSRHTAHYPVHYWECNPCPDGTMEDPEPIRGPYGVQTCPT